VLRERWRSWPSGVALRGGDVKPPSAALVEGFVNMNAELSLGSVFAVLYE
jgi:hypothetical protein